VGNSPGFLKFQVMTGLGNSRNVTYAIASGNTRVITNNSFLRTFAFIHASHGVWAVTAALVSLALLTLGVTGLYLWFRNRPSRVIGGALFLFGATTAIGLIVAMRLG
jgi:hypothetical protein